MRLSIKHKLIISFSTTLLLFVSFLSRASNTDQPNLVTHYYGNPSYFHYAGEFDTKSLNFNVDMNRLKWPGYKHGVFSRHQGWSTITIGILNTTISGPYHFKWQGPPAALRLADHWIDLSGERWINLKKGGKPFTLYIRSNTCGQNDFLPTKEDWFFKGKLTWRLPDEKVFTDIPETAFHHTPKDKIKPEPALKFDIPLQNMRRPFIGARDFDVEVPANGFYRFLIAYDSVYPWIPRYANILIDGKPLFYYKASGSYEWLNALNAFQAPCYLNQGRHTLRIHTFSTHLYHTDSTKSIEQMRMGFMKVSPSDPERNSLIVTEVDRDDMVFRKGEKLKIRLEDLTTNSPSISYRLTIRRQRDDSRKIAWSDDLTLEGGQAKAVAEVSYPCDEEGAFEYTIEKLPRKSSTRGETIFCPPRLRGPWSFVVVDPTPIPIPRQRGEIQPAKMVLVDSVDCASQNDTEHHFRDNGTSKVVKNEHGKYRVTGNRGRKRMCYRVDQKAKKCVRLNEGEKGGNFWCSDMDWFAYTMKVKHPNKPHMLTTWIPNDQYREVAIQAFDPITTFYNGAILSTREATLSEPFVKLSFLVWPNGETLDVLAFDDSGHTHDTSGNSNRVGAVQRFELFEFPDGLPPLPQAAEGWNPNREVGWKGEQVDLGVEQRVMAKGWNGSQVVPGNIDKFAFGRGGYLDWKAMLEAWERFGEFCMWRGDNLLTWPVLTYGMTHIFSDHLTNAQDIYGSGYHYRPIDRWRRDQLKLILLVLEKYNMKMALDFQLNRLGADTVIAANPDKQNLKAEDLVLIGADGQPYGFPGKILNPVHPVSKQYLIDMYEEIAKKYATRKAFAGINTRHWTWTSGHAGWFVKHDAGYGDFTTKLFEKETGIKIPVDDKDPKRFQKRFDWLMKKPQRDKWFQWRADKVKSLKEAQLAAIRKHAPQAQLFGTPDVVESNLGQGLDHVALKGRKDLGFGIQKKSGEPGTEINKLDPATFANFDIREPAEIRGTLENHKTGRERGYPQGLNSGHGTGIRCHPYQLQEPAQFLSEGPLDTLLLQGQWILPPMDEGIRRFIRAFRTIPSTTYQSIKTWDSSAFCWYGHKDGDLVFYVASQSDKPQKISITTRNAGRSITDWVTGKEIGSATRGGLFDFMKSEDDRFDIQLSPFQLRVFKSDGEGKIVGMELASSLPQTIKDRQLDWFIKAAKHRRFISIAIQPHEGDDVRWATLVAGELMRGISSNEMISVDSVVAVMNNKRIPMQIDERDKTGTFVNPGNGILDYDDEILLKLSPPISAKSADIQVYFGGPPEDKIETPSSLTVVPNVKLSRNITCAYQVKNQHLEFGIMPKAPDGPRQNTPAWWHQGLIGSLVVGGKQYLSHHQVHTHIPVGWMAPVESIKLVASGPLRAIVETRYKPTNVEFSLLKNRNGYLRNATRVLRFELRDTSPIIRLEEELDYDKTLRIFDFPWQYMSAYPGGEGALSKTQIFVGTPKTVETFKLSDIAQGSLDAQDVLTRHIGKNSTSLIAAFNPDAGGLAYIGAPFNNRLTATVHKGASLKKGDRTVTFGIFYGSKNMPPHELRRRYWVLPSVKMDTNILSLWRTRYDNPIKTRYGVLETRENNVD